MTSQSSITKKEHAGFLPLFGFTAKQFWTTILLFTIILFFVLPVPILMVVSERTIMDADDLLRLKQDISEDWTLTIRYVIVVIMSIFGVVVSCSRFKYLKNKISIDFYHSLPIKRGQLFLTQLGVSALSLAIPYIFNILFTLIVIASNGLVSETLIVNVLIMSAEAFVYTAFFFALSTIVGMISGLTAVQLTLTLVAIFIVPATVITVLAFVDIFNENMWFSFYANPSFFEKLSPALKFVFSYPDPLSAIESVTLLIVSALILIGAYFIYMQRKSERAGTPVVFAPLGEVIKYVLVFLGTMLGGLLFYYIMDSFAWTVFGMVCGMVLVFMLTNTILNKTARAMFNGWKGLCVFGASVAVVFTLLMTNAFGINSNIPKPEHTARVVVNFRDGIGNVEFRDKDVIEAIHSIYTEGKWAYDGPYNRMYYEDSTYLELVFYPKFGIPIAKTVYIFEKSSHVEEFRTILDSEEFKEQYIAVFDSLVGEEGYMNIDIDQYEFTENGEVVEGTVRNPNWRFSENEFELSSLTAKNLGLDLLREENKACGFDFFQQPNYGRVYTYNYNSYSDIAIFLPIFVSMDSLTDHYIENKYLSYSTDEYLNRLTDAIDKLEIHKSSVDGTEKTMSVTDKKQIYEILSNTTSPAYSFISAFTFIEPSYYVSYTFEATKKYETVIYYDEHGNEVVESVPADTGDQLTRTRTHELAFLLGRVPEFIVEKLG